MNTYLVMGRRTYRRRSTSWGECPTRLTVMYLLVAIAYVWLALLTVQLTRVTRGLDATYRHLTDSDDS